MSSSEWDDVDASVEADVDEDTPDQGHDQSDQPEATVTELTVVDDPETPPLRFTTLEEFVREFVCEVFRREVSPGRGVYWSAQWWRIPEAVLRLEAMWRSFEHLRHDPALGMSVWLRDHADPQLAALMSQEGPFSHSTAKCSLTEPLPHEDPPPGLFQPADEGAHYE